MKQVVQEEQTGKIGAAHNSKHRGAAGAAEYCTSSILCRNTIVKQYGMVLYDMVWYGMV